MSAALMAPIEMPAVQSGCSPASARRFVDACLIGAERAAALQQQGDAFERRPARQADVNRRCRRAILDPNIVAHDELLSFSVLTQPAASSAAERRPRG